MASRFAARAAVVAEFEALSGVSSWVGCLRLLFRQSFLALEGRTHLRGIGNLRWFRYCQKLAKWVRPDGCLAIEQRTQTKAQRQGLFDNGAVNLLFGDAQRGVGDFGLQQVAPFPTHAPDALALLCCILRLSPSA